MKSSTQRFDMLLSQLVDTKSRKITSIRSRKYLWFGYILTLIISDLLMMLVAYRLAYFVRFELSIGVFELDAITSKPFYATISFLVAPAWLLINYIVGLYNRQNLLGGTIEYSLVFRATTVNLLLLIVAGFLQPDFVIARGWLIMAWGFSFALVSASRFWLRRVVYLLRQKGYFLSPAIIIGANDEGISLARQLLNWPTSGLDVLGFVDKKLKPGTTVVGNLRVIGSLEQLHQIVEELGVGDIIMASSAITSHDSQLDIFKYYGFDSDVNVRMSSGLYEIITTGLSIKEFAYVPLVGVNKVRLTGTDLVLKMIMEYTLVIPSLIFLSPFFLLIAIAIKIDSPGPVFHRRRVMGVNGTQFDAFKFRTMRIDGDEILDKHPELKVELEKNHKLKDDPRITKLGHFLRRFSIDELPQLFNVVKMDMALVGPRMVSPEEMKNYNQWGMNLLTVRPGLTGLWQVSGRSDLSYKDRVRLDMYYVRNWSIWEDLQLIWRTIPVVIRGSGAY